MAERRLLTARDVKSNVEGYSEMSDEAFARRFYSDRAELLALGVPLQSQRDEFTGEELDTLRSEEEFLPQIELRGAAPARAAEPRARTARLRGADNRHRAPRRGTRSGLLAGDAGTAREARGR